jgi:hypothetical protein
MGRGSRIRDYLVFGEIDLRGESDRQDSAGQDGKYRSGFFGAKGEGSPRLADFGWCAAPETHSIGSFGEVPVLLYGVLSRRAFHSVHYD